MDQRGIPNTTKHFNWAEKMTVCDLCGEIEMNGIGNLCRQCEHDIDIDEDYQSKCSECNETFSECDCAMDC